MLPWGARVTWYPGQSKAKERKAEASKAKQSRSEANQTVTPRVSHVTPGRACHMLPWGARVTCYPGQSKAKESKAEASKAKESRSKANQTVTPRVAHVTPGRACHMLPWGARVTFYPGQGKAKQSKAKQMQAKPSQAKQSQAKPSFANQIR